MVLISFTKVLKYFEVGTQYGHQSKVGHMYFSEGILVYSADWRKHKVFSLCSVSQPLPTASQESPWWMLQAWLLLRGEVKVTFTTVTL